MVSTAAAFSLCLLTQADVGAVDMSRARFTTFEGQFETS